MTPNSLVLDCHSLTDDARGFARAAFGALVVAGFPPLRRWINAAGEEGTEADLAVGIAALAERTSPRLTRPSTLTFELDDLVRGSLIFAATPGRQPYASLHLARDADDDDKDADWTGFGDRCVGALTQLLVDPGLYGVELRAHGGGGEWLPSMPLARGKTWLALADPLTVARYYDDPEAYWAAGWHEVARHGEQQLLARGSSPPHGTDYLASIVDGHWQMARALKPGLATYGEARPLPEEQSVYSDGESRLQFVGYSAADKLAEYSCYLEPGQHIPGWEIFALQKIVADSLIDGQPVSTVRIVFLDEAAARSERRPLRDVGCRVFFYDEAGELIEITD